jgi:hypothetical protein
MERVWSTSHRGFSVRSILTFVLTVFITALLWVAFGSHTPIHAADGGDVNWKGDSLIYADHQYFPAADAKAGDSTGLAAGTKYYVYIEQISDRPLVQKAHIIAFKPGVDPPTATSADYAVYNYSADKVYSNPQGKTSITVKPQGTSDEYQSSCAVEGIGWIICPVTVFLSNGMDTIFKAVASFMAVQPVTTGDSTNSLYLAWNIMRSIANIAFIIVFLIIIYSQITNVGLSNYGLKKLLPRLIVAAVLVNVSYFITSIAVDLSNILGYSIQDIFIHIRQGTFNITNDTWSNSTTNWTSITTVVLSGGAIGIAGVALAGDVAGALYVLLPLIVGLILTALFVLLILAARQAIIVILIIISPLAFVAYLLPNTEQWFKKWRELFMTMLIFFPAFSLVFGGSQLAGGLIIQNASSVFMIILGLAVQVAPLAITPLLLRFSGNVLGKIAGIINDPRKGVLDRTKNWSKERQDMRRMQSLRNTKGRANPFRRTAQFLNNNGQNVKNRTAQYTMENDNRYRKTPGYEKIHAQTEAAELAKGRIDNELKAHGLREAVKQGTELNLRTIELENSKVDLEVATDNSNAMLTEYRANGYDFNANAILENNRGKLKVAGNTADRLRTLQTSMARQVIESAAQKQRQVAAQYVQQKAISTELSNNNSQFLDIAQGIGGDAARVRARSTALAALNKLEAEALENNVKLLSEVALRENKTVKQYSYDVVTSVSKGATQYSESDFAAALQAQANEKNITLFENVRGSKFVNQELVSKIIIANAGAFKEAGGYHLQDDLSLNVDALGGGFEEKLAAKRVETLGNASADSFNGLKFGWVAEFAKNAKENIAAANDTDVKKAYNNARNALLNPDILAKLGDRENEIRAIEAALAERLGQAPLPDPREPGTY